MRYLTAKIGDRPVLISADIVSKIHIDVEGGKLVEVEMVKGKQVVKVDNEVVYTEAEPKVEEEPKEEPEEEPKVSPKKK